MEVSKALHRAEQVYRANLLASQPAIAYLMARGIGARVAKAFGIGYAGESFKALASALDATAGAEAGLLSIKGGIAYDRFVNRIMFPIRDENGALVGFAGRVIKESDEVLAKYVNSPETEFFKKGKILYALHCANIDAGGLIVVEGFLDVVAMHQNGFCNTVGSMGTAVTRHQMQLLKSKTNNVIFCFDGDAAGFQAAKASFAVAAQLLDESFSVDYVFLPEGHDPDSLLRQHGAVGMRQCLGGKLSFSEAVFSVFSSSENIEIPEGRAHVLAQVKPIAQAMPNFRVRENFCHVMQAALGLQGLNIQEYMEI